MLKSSSTQAVTALVAKLGRSGVALSPLPGTPLAVVTEFCVSTSDLTNNVPVVSAEDIDTLGNQLVTETQTPNAFNENPHDQAMDTIITAGVKVLNENNTLARNVVNPIVETTFNRTQALIDEAGNSGISPLSILAVKTDPIWNSNALVSLISMYAKAPVTNAKIERWWSPMDYENLRGLVRSGSSAFDGELAQYLDRMGVDVISTVYTQLFQKPTMDTPFNQLNDYLNSSTEPATLLVANLMARSLKRDIPTGVSGVSRVTYEGYLLLIVEQTGRLMNRYLERQAFQTSSRVLVLQYPSVDFEYITAETGVIQVNGSLYDQWLAEGGSPEVIFGAFVSGAARSEGRDYNSLLTNADSFRAAWRRKHSLLVAHQNTVIYNTTISALRRAVAEAIVALDDTYVVVQSRSEYQTRLVDGLAKLPRDIPAESLYAVVRNLVCTVLFAHTNALEILTAIDTHMVANPDLEPREAALLANVDAVANWLVAQIHVETFEVE